MEENDRLQKQVSQLVYENSYFRQQTQNVYNCVSFVVYHSPFFLLMPYTEEGKPIARLTVYFTLRHVVFTFTIYGALRFSSCNYNN